MLSIQDLGLQIMNDNPQKLYILGGIEFGIKERYIEKLASYYNGNVSEVDAVGPVIDLMSRKQIIPLEPTLYVVRYDEQFISDLTEAYALKINKLKVAGTIVMLYENPKHVSKCDKFFPECTAEIGRVGRKFVIKYLHSDFPRLDDRCIEIATDCSTSYGHARRICSMMQMADPVMLAKMPEEKVAELFGCSSISSEKQIQIGVASRNFGMLCNMIEKYPDDYDKIVYTILQTMLELEKIKSSKYSDSPLKEYAKLWSFQDIYYMFMNGYNELKKLRSMSSYETYSSLIYLIGLLKFASIPDPEVMEQC